MRGLNDPPGPRLLVLREQVFKAANPRLTLTLPCRVHLSYHEGLVDGHFLSVKLLNHE